MASDAEIVAGAGAGSAAGYRLVNQAANGAAILSSTSAPQPLIFVISAVQPAEPTRVVCISSAEWQERQSVSSAITPSSWLKGSALVAAAACPASRATACRVSTGGAGTGAGFSASGCGGTDA